MAETIEILHYWIRELGLLGQSIEVEILVASKQSMICTPLPLKIMQHRRIISILSNDCQITRLPLTEDRKLNV